MARRLSLLLALTWLLAVGPPSRDDAAKLSPGDRREPAAPYLLEALPPALESRLREVTRFRQGEGVQRVRQDARRAFAFRFNQWTASDLGPERRLRVCFLGGNPTIRRTIAEIAREWTKFGNVNLDFGQTTPDADPRVHQGPDSYEIHVSFLPGQDSDDACWSLLGTEAKQVGAGEATMGFPKFDYAPKPMPYLKYYVLHEFGHALGLNHEHQKHRTGCRLDLQKVVRSFPDGINVDLLRKQYIELNHYDQVVPGIQIEFDPKSVMNYVLPADWFDARDGTDCGVGWNFELCDGDRQAVELLYGKRDSDAAGAAAADPDGQLNIVIGLLDSNDLAPEVRQYLQGRLRALALPGAPDHGP
jgi:hypothetical protein